MPAPLSRRALLAWLVTPVLAAGCGAPAAPTATPAADTSAATPSPAAAGPTPTAVAASAGTATPAGATVPATSAPAVAASAAPATSATPATGQGGRLVQGWPGDVRTLNPLFATDAVSLQATGLLFNGLIKIRPDTLAPEPDLALRWQAAPDDKTYTFTLRPDATFHDGRPCTADDVKFTYDLLLSERASAPAQPALAPVLESVMVKSPTEVEFRLKVVAAAFLVVHAGYGILPKHLLSGLEPPKIEQSDFSLGKPVGTGPFRLKEWTRGQELTLARHDGYFAGRPALDEVVLKVVPSAELLAAQLGQGQVDLAIVRESDAEELGRQAHLTLSRVDSLSITYLAFQLDQAKSPLFTERRVRQALAHALDRPALLRQARAGIGRPGAGPIPPPFPAADERLAARLAYDPARAESLLDAAGWAKGADGIRGREGKKFSFELLTSRGGTGGRAREQYAQLIAEAWRKVGVEAKPVVLDFTDLVNRLRRTHDFETFLTAFAFDLDPDPRLLWTTEAYKSGFNASRYSSAEVDRLLEQAVETTDPARRRDLYRQAQEILVDDAPAIVLDYPQTVYALNRRLRNVVPGPAGLTYNAHTWAVADQP